MITNNSLTMENNSRIRKISHLTLTMKRNSALQNDLRKQPEIARGGGYDSKEHRAVDPGEPLFQKP